MKILGWVFIWLSSVAFGADALLSLEKQSLTLVRLGELSRSMGGPSALPQTVSAIPTLVPLFLFGILLLAISMINTRRRRPKRLFHKRGLR
jgi:hypothetical protein